MTLQDLIDELNTLPASARTAVVLATNSKEDVGILSVDYQHGEVLVLVDGMDESYEEGHAKGYDEGYEAGQADD